MVSGVLSVNVLKPCADFIPRFLIVFNTWYVLLKIYKFVLPLV